MSKQGEEERERADGTSQVAYYGEHQDERTKLLKGEKERLDLEGELERRKNF